jgi:ABC-type Fe3+-hydroxamate transport system substrate-binding protein
MNDNLETISKQTIVTKFEVLFEHFSGENEETYAKPQRIVGLRPKI